MSYLKISNLSKNYRSHWTYRVKSGGLKNVSFEIQQGEAFALLGGNGAGKTTTIKCILGLIKKGGGEILFEGNTKVDHSRLGFLPEQPYFYQHLSVRETLDFYAGLFKLNGRVKKQAVDNILDRLKILEFEKRKVKSLSKGQQQRVAIAQAIINDPDFIILDEPFSGLDPLARLDIKTLFRELRGEGKTLMISSHVLSDIEELCDRAVILKKGESKKEVNIRELNNINTKNIIYKLVIRSDKSLLPELQDAFKECVLGERFLTDTLIELQIKSDNKAEELLKELVLKNYTVIEFVRKQRSLEEVFVEVNEED